MNISKYGSYTDEQWHEFYHNNVRIPNMLRDLALYEELATQADNGEFETSTLKNVQEYIMKQI